MPYFSSGEASQTMLPPPAFARGAPCGRPRHWLSAVIPAFSTFLLLIPVLIWCQRVDKTNRWRATEASSSEAKVRPTGRGQPWRMLPPREETGSTNGRSTQQIDRTQVSYTPSLTYRSRYPYISQQAGTTVAPPVFSSSTAVAPPVFSTSTALPTRPATAGAHSYPSQAGITRSRFSNYPVVSEVSPSVTSSGTTPIASVTQQFPNEAPYSAAVAVNRRDALPTVQQNNAVTVSLGSIFPAPQTPLLQTPSIRRGDSADNVQRVYGAYTSSTPIARATDDGSAGGASLPTRTTQPVGEAQAHSTFLPGSLENSSGWSIASAVSSASQSFPITSIITPWGSQTQQPSDASLKPVAQGLAGEGTTSVFHPGLTDSPILEHRIKTTPQSAWPLAPTLPWLTEPSSRVQTSQSASSSTSARAQTERAKPHANSTAFAIQNGLESTLAESSGPPLSTYTGTTSHTGSRASATPTLHLTPVVDSRTDRSYVQQQASSGPSHATVSSENMDGEAVFSAHLSEVGFVNDERNVTMSDRGDPESLDLHAVSPWGAPSGRRDQSTIKDDDDAEPGDSALKDSTSQAYVDAVSGLDGHGIEQPSPSLSTGSLRGSSGTSEGGPNASATPCQQLRSECTAPSSADQNGTPPPKNGSSSFSAAPFAEQLSSPAAQWAAQDARQSDFSGTVSSHYEGNVDRASAMHEPTSQGTHEANPATQRKAIESVQADTSDLTSSVTPNSQDTIEGTPHCNVQQDTATGRPSEQAHSAVDKDEVKPQIVDVPTRDDEVCSSEETNDAPSGQALTGYIPEEALASSSAGVAGDDLESTEKQPLYGDLKGYMTDMEDPFLKNLSALGKREDTSSLSTVTTTSTTTTTQTYPPFYNPYSDNLDVDDIPDSPYHNYKWAVDPFPSTYSTHSRLENYESEFNNRYYHEERTAPNITWEEYTRRRKEVDDAHKREAELQNESSIGLIESSDSLFQGLIGYPNRGHTSRLPV